MIHKGRNKGEKTPEIPTIRPPSEWRSILVRLTRGCKWNRCRFCGIYPHLGVPNFSIRSIDEVKHDIDLLHILRPRGETVFFGDADPLEIGVETFCRIAEYLRSTIPVKRLTCYARASTFLRIGPEAVKDLSRSGLNRVHLGLESGDEQVLQFQRKGQTPAMVAKVADWLKQAGIEVSFYVLLGLGGQDRWREHIAGTFNLINQTEPDFVRIRRLWLYGDGSGLPGTECPLWKEIRAGSFKPQCPEGTVQELHFLLDGLTELKTFFACDHVNNYVRVAGMLKSDRQEMLAEVESFLTLPLPERNAHYTAVGSRI